MESKAKEAHSGQNKHISSILQMTFLHDLADKTHYYAKRETPLSFSTPTCFGPVLMDINANETFQGLVNPERSRSH